MKKTILTKKQQIEKLEMQKMIAEIKILIVEKIKTPEQYWKYALGNYGETFDKKDWKHINEYLKKGYQIWELFLIEFESDCQDMEKEDLEYSYNKLKDFKEAKKWD